MRAASRASGPDPNSAFAHVNDPSPVIELLSATAIKADWNEAPSDTTEGAFALDLTNQPSPLKSYPGVPARRLSRDLLPSSRGAVVTLSGNKAPQVPLDDVRLAAILFLGGGVTRGRRTPAGAPVWFRTSMSAGNLHPIELYVVQDGVWHYDPLLHRLDLIRPADESVSNEGATVVVTGIPARTCWKYAARGFRHLFWDAGTMLANLLSAADAYGVSSSVSLGFDDAEVGALLGIEAPDEVPIALVALGAPEQRLDDRGLGPIARARPIARTPIRLDGVTAALRASCLAAADVAPWREQLRRLSTSTARTTVPPHPFDDASTEEVILRRGSSRRFRPTAVPRSLFDWALRTAMQPPELDVAVSGLHIGLLLHVHDVEEVESGVWSDSAELQLISRRDTRSLREQSMRCCLGQDLGGDAGLTVFLTADLEHLFEQAGGRAYRVAAIEAGIVAGRLALCATALGAGSTGLTFVDELVTAELRGLAFGVMACALGTPAALPAPHGSPGAPHRL